MSRILDRSIVLVGLVVVVGALYALPSINDGNELSKLNTVTGIALNLVALWGIVWAAPKLVRAAERHADATARIAAKENPPSTVATENPNLEAAQLFDAYSRFAQRHPAHGAGVAEDAFRRMSWLERRRYRRYMLRVVGFLGAIFDVAGKSHEAAWKRKVWDVLALHPAAAREWREELGIDDLRSK